MRLARILGLLVVGGGVCFGGCEWTPPVPLLDGFGFSWQLRPHRINKIGARIDGIEGCLTLEGGSWATGEEASDTADHSLEHTTLASSQIIAYHGESSLMTLWGSKAKAAAGEEKIVLSRSAMGMATCVRHAVVLRGFGLDTDITHKDGYTTRGLGARITDVKTAGDSLQCKVSLRIGAGAVPDRIQHLEKYGATGRIYFTVLGLLSGEVTPKSHGYALSYPAGVNPVHPHASLGQQLVVIQGTPGYPVAVVGLTGFDFRLNPDANLYPGRYLREIAVRDHGFKYDPAGGKMAFFCDGYFSNSGAVAYALQSEFAADFVLIQTGDGGVSHRSQVGTQQGVEDCISLSGIPVGQQR